MIWVDGAGQGMLKRAFKVVTGVVWGGWAYGGVKGRSQLPCCGGRYLAGDIKSEEMITEVLPLERINEAFDLMREGKVIRPVIHY